jgi:hypothetical protein
MQTAVWWPSVNAVSRRRRVAVGQRLQRVAGQPSLTIESGGWSPVAAFPTGPKAALCGDYLDSRTDCAPFMRGFSPPPTHVVARQGVLPSDIDLAVFSEHLCTCRCPRAMGGRRNHHTVFGARLFRQHLVEIGVCHSAAAALQHPEPCLLAQFKVWLRKHRGASDRTIKLSARDASHLMAALGDEPEGWGRRSYRPTRAAACVRAVPIRS